MKEENEVDGKTATIYVLAFVVVVLVGVILCYLFYNRGFADGRKSGQDWALQRVGEILSEKDKAYKDIEHEIKSYNYDSAAYSHRQQSEKYPYK